MPLKEANVPEHRWYQKRYNARLARDDYSKDWIYPSGLRRIDEAFMRAEGYMVSNHVPKTMADFKNGVYVVDGIQTTFSAAFQHTATSNATMTGGYGPELVTNGSFDSDTGWTLNANGGSEHSISNGKFISTNSADLRASTLDATGLIAQNGVYEVTVVVRSITSGSFRVMAYSDVNYGATPNIDTAGVHKFQIEITEAGTAYLDNFVIQARAAGSTFEIDNISVREVPKIQWRPHNLVTHSEDLASGGRAYGTGVISDNDFTFTASSDYFRMGSTMTVPSKGKYTGKVTISGGEVGDTFALELVDDADGSDSNTTIVTIDGVTTEWTVEADFSGSSTFSGSLGFYINRSSASRSVTAGSTITVNYMHVYRSDLGGMADVPASERVIPTATKYVRTAGRVIGPELVTNGTFDTDTDWTKGTGWTISGGVASNAGTEPTYQTISQTLSNNAGVFEVTVTSSGNTNVDGRLVIELDGNQYVTGTGSDANGVFKVALLSNASGVLKFGASTTSSNRFNGSIDNISVREIDVNPSAARYLPRVNHHAYNGSQWVNKGLFVESEARTNLVPYSSDTTGWTASSGAFTTSAATAPDGSTDAFLFTPNAGTVLPHARTGAFAASTGVHAVYLKDNGITTVSIWHDDGISNRAVFDLTTGEVSGITADAAGMESVGNGWYRCWVYSDIDTATNIRIYGKDGSTYSANGTDGFYIWGAQAEVASTPSSYIPTNGASVTRPAESITIPAANLPWPNPVYVTGEELVTNGTFDTDTSGWTARNSTITQTTYLGQNCMSVADDGTYSQGYQAITTVAGGVYEMTMSIALQAGATQTVALDIYSFSGVPPLSAGDVFNKDWLASDLSSSEFTEVTVRFVASSTSTTIAPRSNSTETAYFDNISVKEINPLALSIQMKGEMTYADTDGNPELKLWRHYADANNYLEAALYTNGVKTGDLAFLQSNSGVLDLVSTADDYFSPDINVPFNISSRHGSTFINGAVDGVALTADTTPVALPDLENTDLELAYDFMGTISLFRMWANDLGDTGIEEATEPSTQATLFLSFDGSNNSYVDFEWSE